MPVVSSTNATEYHAISYATECPSRFPKKSNPKSPAAISNKPARLKRRAISLVFMTEIGSAKDTLFSVCETTKFRNVKTNNTSNTRADPKTYLLLARIGNPCEEKTPTFALQEPSMKLLTDSFLVFYFNESTAAFLKKSAEQLNVEYHFQRKAKLRLGSFRATDRNAVARIFVCKDLPPGQMLIVLCHELAHAMVWRENRRRVKPHGIEWQFAYQLTLKVAMELFPFDEEWKAEALRQIEKPRATYKMSPSDLELEAGQQTVASLPDGAVFFHRGNQYKKLHLRRTRFLCARVGSRRKYLFHGTVGVTPVN